MRIFEHPNMVDFECPVCHTNDDKPVALIVTEETNDHGSHISKAIQVHVSCINLVYITMNKDKWFVQLVE